MKNTNLFRLAFLLFAGLSIFLSSCQPKEEGDKKYVIGFSQCTSDSWREAVLLEMQIEASNYRNVELVVYNAMDNSSRQVSQIRKLISQNVDVLIISPNEAVPITDVAVEAYRKGIPTIIHDLRYNRMNIRSLSVPIITTLVLPLVNTLTDNCPPTPKYSRYGDWKVRRLLWSVMMDLSIIFVVIRIFR